MKRLKESKELLDSLTKDHVRLEQNQIRRVVLKAKNVTIENVASSSSLEMTFDFVNVLDSYLGFRDCGRVNTSDSNDRKE